MTRKLKPWAEGPFDVLLHAELHLLMGEDVHRRIAMISYDNAIELSVTAYLNLNPMARGGREYRQEDVKRWLNNYHSKVEFFFYECGARNAIVLCKQDEIIWFHDLRNGQYHSGGPTVPQISHINGVRSAAIEVFSVLFEQEKVESLLAEQIAALLGPSPQPRTAEQDRIIDHHHDMIVLCGQPEYTSNVLYALDPSRYHEVASELERQYNEMGDDGDVADE